MRSLGAMSPWGNRPVSALSSESVHSARSITPDLRERHTTPSPRKALFLDVDGVLQPVKPNGLPANADLEELERRTDEESEWLFREGSDVQLGGEFQFRRVKGEFDLR